MSLPSSTVVRVVLFKRQKNSRFERGVQVGEYGTVIDKDSKSVRTLYELKPTPHHGCFRVNLGGDTDSSEVLGTLRPRSKTLTL